MQLDLVKKFKRRLQEINDLEDSAICLDFIMMANVLIKQVDKKLAEVDGIKIDKFLDNAVQTQIRNLVVRAKGCPFVCDFCHRKCEREPHDDQTKHHCDRLGH